MRRKQRGATAAGFVIMAIIVGMLAFGGIRLIPIYLEQMKVATILNDIKREMDGTKTSATQIRSAISKRIDIEMVRNVDAKKIRISKVDNGAFEVHAQYERRERYIANVFLVVVFDKSVEIQP